MSDVVSSTEAKWRVFIPDLFEIHSSDVSTNFERSSFESFLAGK